MTDQLRLANHIARKLGLPPTWPNLRTIEIALIFQAAQGSSSLQEAADLIVDCGRVFLALSPGKQKLAGLARYWPLNRFWFEDAIWLEFVPMLPCRRHPDYGRTVSGGCWGCYEEQTRGQGGCRPYEVPA